MAKQTILPFNISMDLLKTRIETQCVAVRNLWFPSRAEMMEWQASEKLMYVRWTGPLSLEMGLRQETMAAARMAPQWFVTVVPDAPTPTFRFHRGFPKYTQRLVAILAMSIGAWGFFVPIHWTGLWRGTALILLCTTFLAWYVGNQKLKQERSQLEHLFRDTTP